MSQYETVTTLLATIETSEIYRSNLLVQQIIDVARARITKIASDDETELQTFVTQLKVDLQKILQPEQIKNTCTPQEALSIMGENGHTIEDMKTHLNATYTPAQLTHLQRVPFSKATLEKYKHTHILVPGAPVSINNTRIACEALFDPNATWHKTQPFSDRPMDITWHLLRKTPVADSHNKTYDQQTELIKQNLPGEVVACAKNLVPAILLHYKATLTTKGQAAAEKLMADLWVRCQEEGSDGFRVNVRFHSDGFGVSRHSDANRNSTIAVASALEVPDTCILKP